MRRAKKLTNIYSIINAQVTVINNKCELFLSNVTKAVKFDYLEIDSSCNFQM